FLPSHLGGPIVLRRLFGGSDQQATFKWRHDDDDVVITLERAGAPLAFDSWATARPDAASALSDLLASNEDAGDETKPAVVAADNHLRLAPEIVAKADMRTASLLSLPPPTPLALDLRAQSRIDPEDFRLP